MLRDHSIVCISMTPWETPLPSTAHFLMREFSRHNQVLFVDRPLSAKDLWTHRANPQMASRMARTLRRMPPLRSVGDGSRELHVLTPPPIVPMNFLDEGPLYRQMLQANGKLLQASVQQAMRRLGMRDALLWIFFDLPTGLPLIGTLGERLSIYHCFDEITGEPYIARHGAWLESQTFEKVDLVFTTSPGLQEAKRHAHPCCHCIPNGVDFEHYHRALSEATPIATELAELRRPIVGYLGNLESRVDFRLIETLALERPGWTIALIGPSEGLYREKLRILETLPNVLYLGPKPPERAPEYLKAFDAAIIPFRRSAQTQAIYPLKINEYLAAGKPVVMTDFAPLDEFRSVAWIARNTGEFLNALDRAIAPATPWALRARTEFARRNDWHHRADTASRVLVQHLIAQNRARVLGA